MICPMLGKNGTGVKLKQEDNQGGHILREACLVVKCGYGMRPREVQIVEYDKIFVYKTDLESSGFFSDGINLFLTGNQSIF